MCLIVKTKMKKKSKTTKKTICQMSFTRVNGHQCLEIKIDEALEEAFKSPVKKTSKSHKSKDGKGLRFYSDKPGLAGFVESYRDDRSSPPVENLDNYGTYMVNSIGYLNFSVVRTVGISKGIEIVVNNILLDRDVEVWIGEFAKFLKFTYENLVGEKKITAVVTIAI